MYKAYKFRLYPNDKQELLINKTFGCYRFIYNYFLDKCKNNGYQKAFDMCTKLKEKIKPKSIVGIDLGIKDLVVT